MGSALSQQCLPFRGRCDFVNIIVFDKNYKLLTMGWTRVPATPLVKHTLTLADINIKEPGYIFVYLSYESLSNNFFMEPVPPQAGMI